MDKRIAKEMHNLLERFGRIFDEAGELTLQITDPDEARAVRRVWGNMLECTVDLSLAIYKVDPSLRPDD